MIPILPVFVDLVLRLLIVEKRDAIKWIQAGVEIPGFEAAGYTPKVVSKGGVLSSAPIPMITINGESDVEEEVEVKRKPSEWNAFLSMLTSPRAITCFALAMLNGIILGGALGKLFLLCASCLHFGCLHYISLTDVGMVLWLEHQYKLSSLGAGTLTRACRPHTSADFTALLLLGLVFIGAIVPTFVVRSLSYTSFLFS